jgi:hypothetical protein
MILHFRPGGQASLPTYHLAILAKMDRTCRILCAESQSQLKLSAVSPRLLPFERP